MQKKSVLCVLMLVFLVSSVQAATVLNPPLPVAMRDANQRQFSGLLLAYANTGNTASDSDGGFNPFEEGIATGTDLETNLPFTIDEFNGDPLNINNPNTQVEFVTNFEVFDGTNWIPATGYTAAVILNTASGGMGHENGLGDPTLGVSTYSPTYLSYAQGSVQTDRFYAAPFLSYPGQFSTTPFGTQFREVYQNVDQDNNRFAFSTIAPFYNLQANVQITTGFCPTPAQPVSQQQLWVVGGGGTATECLQYDSYIAYVDHTTGNLGNEATPSFIAGSSAYGLPNVWEDFPSIVDNEIVRASNAQNPGSWDVDILGYDILSAAETFSVPEISMVNPRFQTRPSLSHPNARYVAFLETDIATVSTSGNTATSFGELHIFDRVFNTRTVTPLGGTSSSHPKAAYDGIDGVVAWRDVGGGLINYVTLSATGYSTTVNTIPLPAWASFATMGDVASTNTGPIIDYILENPASGREELWRFNVLTGTNTYVHGGPGTNYIIYTFLNTLHTGHSGEKIAIRTSQGMGTETLIFDMDPLNCLTPPCSVYGSKGLVGRTVAGNYYFVIPRDLVIDKRNTAPYGTHYNQDFLRLDLSNI